jgi:predicted metal-dependent RNase
MANVLAIGLTSRVRLRRGDGEDSGTTVRRRIIMNAVGRAYTSDARAGKAGKSIAPSEAEVVDRKTKLRRVSFARMASNSGLVMGLGEKGTAQMIRDTLGQSRIHSETRV